MDSRDRDAITGLFRKLREVERQSGPRDAEAERLVADETQRLAGAPYYMAQTIVMQDMALAAKQQEVDELKKRLEQGSAEHPASGGGEGGGFLSRMFGGGQAAQPSSRPVAPQNGPWGAPPPASPGYPQQGYGQPQYAPPPPYAPQGGGFGRGMGGGGGFLAGAAQTAMGVAGGVVLGNAIGSMFGGGHGGLFGGGGAEQPTEVVNETTNIYEGDTNVDADRQDAADPNGNQDDAGYQDASYDDTSDPGFDDGGGYDDV